MTARITTTAVVLGLAAAALAGAGPARAQHSGGHGEPHGAGLGAPGAPHSGHHAAQRCAEEFEAVVAKGLGFGMAFAADQNGYPGPIHVLELKTTTEHGRCRESQTHIT